MQIGPIEIVSSPDPGVWLTVDNGARKNVTIPAVIAAVLVVLTVLCCCGRILF